MYMLVDDVVGWIAAPAGGLRLLAASQARCECHLWLGGVEWLIT
jgi:hypothetical protein